MYISVSDAATKFNISRRRVQLLCEQGRISGANMIDGVWLIPETATKPADHRRKHPDENQMSFFNAQKDAFTIDDICKTLSISKATAKNWIRLGKIVPDMNGQLFSPEYIEKFVADLRLSDNAKLKRRRNKKSMTGKEQYERGELEDLTDTFIKAIRRAERIARRNYKYVVPQYRITATGNRIQFLMPIYMLSKYEELPDFALVLSESVIGGQKFYKPETVLELAWAYNNARVICKPDDMWLNPAKIEDVEDTTTIEE